MPEPVTFVCPFGSEDDLPTYSPKEAYEKLSRGGERTIYIVSVHTEDETAFIYNVSKTSKNADDSILVGSWHEMEWLLYATDETDAAERVADEVGALIDELGPVAVFEEGENEVFPVQGEYTRVVNTAKSDEK